MMLTMYISKVAILIGIVLFIMKSIEMRKIAKELAKAEENQEIPEDIENKIFRNGIIQIVSYSLMTIAAIVLIVLR